jgi:hypothetical protein
VGLAQQRFSECNVFTGIVRPVLAAPQNQVTELVALGLGDDDLAVAVYAQE